MMKKLWFAWLVALISLPARAGDVEHYQIDTRDAHAFITFKIQHLGFSWMEGRFDRFSGNFDYDAANPANNHVRVDIDVDSINTNHAVRDKHLRSAKFFDVDKYPKATFESTGWEQQGDGKATLKGKFTLRGVTRDISINVTEMGAGNDPWGGYRRGFEGTTTLHLPDYNMSKAATLGPAAETIKIWLSLEGVLQHGGGIAE